MADRDVSRRLNPVQIVDLSDMLARTPNARKLNVLCAFLGLTRADVARVSGLSERMLYHTYPQRLASRQDNRVPSFELIDGLAAAFGLDARDLWESEGKPHALKGKPVPTRRPRSPRGEPRPRLVARAS